MVPDGALAQLWYRMLIIENYIAFLRFSTRMSLCMGPAPFLQNPQGQ